MFSLGDAIVSPAIMALLNKLQKAPEYAREKFRHQQLTGMFKNVIQQGHSHFGVRSVPSVREHDKTATCLREAAPAKAGNAAGGFFQHSHYVLSRLRVDFPIEQDQSKPEAVYRMKSRPGHQPNNNSETPSPL